jgi:peptide deformylase
MSALKILHYGDPRLRQPAEKVHKISAKIQKLYADMFDTLYANQCVGLAAPQVGALKRLFVLDGTQEETSHMVCINPVLVCKEGFCLSDEGSPTFPGVLAQVRRYQHITVRYTDHKGRPQTFTPQPGGLLCMAIQHEMDHLDGIVMVDRAADVTATNTLLAAENLPLIDPDRLQSEPQLPH